jgi:O-antigen/teichoic acid export membrane protein
MGISHQTDSDDNASNDGKKDRQGRSTSSPSTLPASQPDVVSHETGSPLKRLLVHTSHYSITNAFAMVAGLVSFPILTRIFSVADYGVMNLISASLTIAVALGKLGVQHSIIRYHSEISAGNSPYTLAQLRSTTLLGMLGMALVVAPIFGFGAQLLPTRWLGDSRIPFLLGIVSVVVLAQVPESALVNFVRAEQKTSTYLFYMVSKKYLGLALILAAVLFVSRTLPAFYAAMVITEVVAVVFLARKIFRGVPVPSPSQFSRPLYFELLRFGVPMCIGQELSNVILAMGARYVIEGFKGEAALGLYAAAYNLCQYVQAIFAAAVVQAIVPLYIQIWENKGSEATAEFISRSLRTYVLLGAPVIAGVAAVGSELLPALASDKYLSSVDILPWVMAGMVVDATPTMLGAGLYVHRKTRVIMLIVGSGALLNLALNLLFVPSMGIQASAVVTLVCYLYTATGMCLAGRRLLPIAIPWATILRAAVGSVLMLLAIQSIYPGRRLATVGVRTVLGAAIYLAVMTLLDRDARTIVRKTLQKVRPSKTP